MIKNVSDIPWTRDRFGFRRTGPTRPPGSLFKYALVHIISNVLPQLHPSQRIMIGLLPELPGVTSAKAEERPKPEYYWILFWEGFRPHIMGICLRSVEIGV